MIDVIFMNFCQLTPKKTPKEHLRSTGVGFSLCFDKCCIWNQVIIVLRCSSVSSI